jgi:hypothetical protein
MKKILIQLDTDKFSSVFDAVTAYDAGVDRLLQYSGIEKSDVQALVHGAMFTRGGDDLKNSAVFVGGSDVAKGEAVFKAVKKSFFGPVSVSVMLDSNGCNTTAAAAVAKIISVGDVAGKKVVILSGTGPVGLRAAAMLAQEGAKVTLTSRTLEKAQAACDYIKKRFDVGISPAAAADANANIPILEDAYAVLCTGAAGIMLISEAVWQEHASLKVLADVNAVPPMGIEGIKPTWNGKEKHGKIVFGALGIGGLKMKIHRACVARLFEQNDLALEAEEIFATAKQTIKK